MSRFWWDCTSRRGRDAHASIFSPSTNLTFYYLESLILASKRRYPLCPCIASVLPTSLCGVIAHNRLTSKYLHIITRNSLSKHSGSSKALQARIAAGGHHEGRSRGLPEPTTIGKSLRCTSPQSSSVPRMGALDSLMASSGASDLR